MRVVHPYVASHWLKMALTSDSRSHVRLPVMLFKVVVASDVILRILRWNTLFVIH